MQVLVKKLGDAYQAESKPIAPWLVYTRSWAFEPYFTIKHV